MSLSVLFAPKDQQGQIQGQAILPIRMLFSASFFFFFFSCSAFPVPVLDRYMQVRTRQYPFLFSSSPSVLLFLRPCRALIRLLSFGWQGSNHAIAQ